VLRCLEKRWWKFYLLDSVGEDALRHAVGVYNDGVRRILISEKRLQGIEVEAPPIFRCRLSLPGAALMAVGVALLFMPEWEIVALPMLMLGLSLLLDREVVGLKHVKFNACDSPRRISTPYMALWTKVPKFCYLMPELFLQLFLLRKLGIPSCPGVSTCGGYFLWLFVGEATEGFEPAKDPTLVSEEHIRMLLR